MPKYLLERQIPGAGELSAQESQDISQKSCGVLNQMGPQIQGFEAISPSTRSTVGISLPRRRWSETMFDRVAGLFFIGEAMDVTGSLGGYNFQRAWAPGYCAVQ